MDYESLLEKAQKSINREQKTGDRFKMPASDVTSQGSSTILNNFTEIVKTFRREPAHFMKFLLRELAVPGELQGNRLTLQGRFTKEQIDKKLEIYAAGFVICPTCGKPDTRLITEDNLAKVTCDACKAKHVVKSLK